jgi:hypothetical protein
MASMPQLYRTAVAGDDYWTSYADWLKGQRGGATGSNKFDSVPRYIRNNRDLALYLLVDWSGHSLRREIGRCAVRAEITYFSWACG